jgi:esterase/lipase
MNITSPRATWLPSALLLAALSSSFGASAQAVNCVTLNHEVERFTVLAQSATYRKLKAPASTLAFDFKSDAPFSEYLHQSREHIFHLNPKAAMPCPIKTDVSMALYGNKKLTVGDLVSPFQIDAENPKAAVLLIHGLTDSPYLFHDLASSFIKQGITVRTLLLPGHGTAPEALINIDEAQWRDAANYAIKQMFKDFDKVYLGGFSTGGALIVDHLNHNPLTPEQAEQLKGVMLWSPASKAKAKMAWAAKYVSKFKRYLDKSADVDFAKYESFATNAGAQVHALMERITPNKLSGLPSTPVFVVASDVDNTIDTKATLALLSHWHERKSEQTKSKDTLIYYGAKQDTVSLPSKINKVENANCEGKPFCSSVLNIAHTSTTNAPRNPHYGWNGHYRNCDHLFGTDKFEECKTTDDPILGETNEATLKRAPSLQRLTFNPYYTQMESAMQVFIQNTL